MTNLCKILIAALSFAMIMLFVQVYLNKSVNDELNMAHFQIDTLEYRIDSMKSEMFIIETEVTRYRMVIETLELESPKAAAEFDKYLSRAE